MDSCTQAFASQFLNADTLACYWLTLLTRIAPLMRYTPGREHRSYPVDPIPVSEYLAAGAGQEYVRKHKLDRMELPHAAAAAAR
ncbi:hypothetical protein FOA52_003744 [Chlamydomonas sp. UWO 241]|nr:hypothetical protein FOA52_003744 [Chlamydomonas sp. UWO 241]